MPGYVWGLLGPEFLPKIRRARTLGLGTSVRLFNELAVPGLGGVRFGKQLLLAILGIAVAETARSRGVKVQNIEVANAIEALGCLLAFKSNGWSSDLRLKGNTKLKGKEDVSFKQVRQRNFYVTQPMRMATVQALLSLGFVESNSLRFNTFSSTEAGRNFIESATSECRPYNRTVVEHLCSWVQNENDRVNVSKLSYVLSPVAPLSAESIPLLSERLIQGGQESNEDKTRRYNALKWMDTIRKKSGAITNQTWTNKPEMISPEHWHDLQTGAQFFKVREAAIDVLDAVEMYIGNQSIKRELSLKAPIPTVLNSTLERLKSAAIAYLKFEHPNEDARFFCKQCVGSDLACVLRFLVNRDGHILRLLADEIKPGAAFQGSHIQVGAEEEEQELAQTKTIPLPEGISFRMRNLFLLNLDMHGELDDWLKKDGRVL